MDACCCCTMNTDEADYKATPLYRNAACAIDAENVDFFSQPKWTANLEGRQIRALFEYAVSRASSPIIIELILRGNIKSLVDQLGYRQVFLSALMSKTSRQSLIDLLSHQPKDFDLTSVKDGFSKKPILHICADYGNLQWLKYFVEDLKLSPSKKPDYWVDSWGYSPLYYAASSKHLDTTKYLVETCSQSPTQQGLKWPHNKRPIDVAKGSSKEFLQKYLLIHYPAGQSQTNSRVRMYQQNAVHTAHKEITERTPLLKAH